MSKKSLTSRLDDLFKDLQAAEPAQQEPARQVSGWSWECDQNGNYLVCSPEVQIVLGVNPQEFLGKSIFHHRLHADSGFKLQHAFRRGQAPIEMDVYILSAADSYLPAHLSILAPTAPNGHGPRFHGFLQMLPGAPLPKEDDSARTAQTASQPASDARDGRGVSTDGKSIRPAAAPWTPAGIQSITRGEAVAHPGGGGLPPALAAPLNLRQRGLGVLEVVDESPERRWSEDEHMLIQEVATQLSLALENAELYQTVQQELNERTRAEQEIRERNQDLSTLNLAGQQLSRLTSTDEILELLYQVICQFAGGDDIAIALYDAASHDVRYPIRVQGPFRDAVERAPLENDVAGYLFWTRKPLLIPAGVEAGFVDRGISIPKRVPRAVMAVPLLTGERILGAILLENYDSERIYTAIQVELLSTLASQAATALENANLFQEIRSALNAIENRERYQANVALVAATLSKYGSRALGEVLAALGEAAQDCRVSYFEMHGDGAELFWELAGEWQPAGFTGRLAARESTSIYIHQIPFIRQQLKETGWIARRIDQMPEPDHHIFQAGVGSSLLIAIPGQSVLPGILCFETLSAERAWQLEEIRIIQVAADALSNTILRENLLKQVQISLRETEVLYNLSHNLALASNFTEILNQVAAGINDPLIDRYLLVTFDYDDAARLAGMQVAATWYRGDGPQPVKTSARLPEAFEPILAQRDSLFIETIDAGVEEAQRAALESLSIASAALFPLWVGRQQIGALVAASDVAHPFTDQMKRSAKPLMDQMATTVENFRLLQRTEQALEETGLLYRISSAISQASGPQDLIKIVLQNLLPRGADRVALLQVNHNADWDLTDLEVIGASHGPTGQRWTIDAIPLVKTLRQDVHMLENVLQAEIDPGSRKALLELGGAAVCLVPLASAGQTIGVLLVASPKPGAYQPEELRTLQVAANAMAIALEKQRLLRETERRALELQTAAELARDTTSTLDLDQLLSRIVSLLCDRFGFYHASIFLLDAARAFAVVRESTGTAGQSLKSNGFKLAVGSKSVIGVVTASGEPLVLSDVSLSPVYYPNPLLPDTRSEMGIPLKLGEQVIGALDLQSTRLNAFAPSDMSVFQILADQIAIAIENARTYELSQRAVEEMREVDRMKSQFLANMSHELRTPLNSIIGFSKVILRGIDGPISEPQSQDLTAIFNSGQHLLGLINDILDLSKIEAGKMELSYSDVNIAEVIDSVMSTAAGLVKGKEVQLQRSVPADLPSVRADPIRVRQVILNFISNAAKFTEQGAITVGVGITSTNARPEMMITVTDTGAGIAAEDRHKLFQPFSQVDDSPTRKTGGTGLGLSICRSLIEMHGGKIGLLRSELGAGSTFYFTLPLEEAAPVIPASLPATRTILSIDDDMQVISLYERYLKPHGYQVVPLTEPKRALEMARQICPAAITLDIMMPEADGWQVMHALKSDPVTRAIPIVVCSILEEQSKGADLGAADYLVKPFLPDDLINAIHRLTTAGQPCDVLVIDDAEDDLRLVQKMLESRPGVRVQLAQGGLPGWEALQANRPDIVILDLFMPDLNGFTILERLRSHPNLASLPVIVLTGAELTGEQQQQMAGLGQRLLAKGRLSESELLDVLEHAIPGAANPAAA